MMRLLPFAVIILFAFTFAACDQVRSDKAFALSPREAHALFLGGDYRISPEDADAIISQSDAAFRFVDIRPPIDFERGHLEGALNIPVQNLLDAANLAQLDQANLTFVLYGEDELAANGPWMILRQLGYDNVKIMQGGLKYVLLARDSTATELPSHQDEASCCDYVALFEAAEKRYEEEMAATKPKPAAIPQPAAPKQIVPKKKKPEVEEEEGC